MIRIAFISTPALHTEVETLFFTEVETPFFPLPSRVFWKNCGHIHPPSWGALDLDIFRISCFLLLLMRLIFEKLFLSHSLQPWKAHGGNTVGPFKWSRIYIRWDVSENIQIGKSGNLHQ